MPAVSIIAHLFKMDPVAVLDGDDYHFAIRHAAAKQIIAAKVGVDPEDLLDD